MLGCRVGTIPQRIDAGQTVLRLAGILDFLSIYKSLKAADPMCLSQLGFKGKNGFFVLTLYLYYLFDWFYIIEDGKTDLGLLGIYSWKCGQELYMTLAIWLADFRGSGIGSAVVQSAISVFRAKGLCRRIMVEVHENNVAGLKFWKGHGFSLVSKQGKILCLSLNIL